MNNEQTASTEPAPAPAPTPTMNNEQTASTEPALAPEPAPEPAPAPAPTPTTPTQIPLPLSKKTPLASLREINSIKDGNPNSNDQSDMISIVNFDMFIDKVYYDVLSSYHFEILSMKVFKDLEKLDVDTSKDFSNQKEKKSIIDVHNNVLQSKIKIFGNKILEKLKEFKECKINMDDFSNFVQTFSNPSKISNFSNQNQEFASNIYHEHNYSISNFLSSIISSSEINNKWLFDLAKTILDMSKVYSDFKKSPEFGINIKEKLYLLRYYYSEVIEKIKKIKLGKSKMKGVKILHLLDDIFLRIFMWADKNQYSSTDSVLLRNAFSHFNMVYDKQSLKDSGYVFEKIFLKNNSLYEYNKFIEGLGDDGYISNTQRIIFYNQKDGGSEADAMLDTNCYQVCRYFMTYCHCLFAIFSNKLENVPFSKTLLEQYESTYGLKVIESSSNVSTKNGIIIKKGGKMTIINKDLDHAIENKTLDYIERYNSSTSQDDISFNQDFSFAIEFDDKIDNAMVVHSFCTVNIISNGNVQLKGNNWGVSKKQNESEELDQTKCMTVYGIRTLNISSNGSSKIIFNNDTKEYSIIIKNGSVTTNELNGEFDLDIKKGGKLNILVEKKGGVIVDGKTSTFLVKVNQKPNEKTIVSNFIRISSGLIKNKHSFIKCYGKSDIESKGTVTTQGSVFIESLDNTIEVKVKEYTQPKDYIIIISHKKNYMVNNMNDKLSGSDKLPLEDLNAYRSKLKREIEEREEILKTLPIEKPNFEVEQLNNNNIF